MRRQRLGGVQALRKADQLLVSHCTRRAKPAHRLRGACTKFAYRMTHEKPMNLVPVRPPGPNARKARAFSSELLQLRAQGYTFEAIREALAAAGIHVSNSTVQREVARAARQRPTVAPTAACEPIRASVVSTSLPSAPPVPASQASTGDSLPADWQSGRDVAEAYTMNATAADPTVPGQGNAGGGRRLEPDSAVVDRGSGRASNGLPVPGATRDGGSERRLTPRQPPGRITRKARAYASEILRLRESGYSFDAIREAFADVGVSVSRSTVWREVMRPTNESLSTPVVGVPRGQAKVRRLVGRNPTTATHP
jgi:hypothetical protein